MMTWSTIFSWPITRVIIAFLITMLVVGLFYMIMFSIERLLFNIADYSIEENDPECKFITVVIIIGCILAIVTFIIAIEILF